MKNLTTAAIADKAYLNTVIASWQAQVAAVLVTKNSLLALAVSAQANITSMSSLATPYIAAAQTFIDAAYCSFIGDFVNSLQTTMCNQFV